MKSGLKMLKYLHASEIQDKEEQANWLIDGLWADQGVGIIGGEPKCYKTFLGMELAVAVGTGTPALGVYKVPKAGRVLLFAAEDSLSTIKDRLQAALDARSQRLENSNIFVITEASMRIDTSEGQEELKATVADIMPQLLILDPFVRLHQIDENISGDVAKLFHFLRELNRLFNTAIMVIHHSKKNSHKSRPGQGLRGSSEFHAWGDSNLYVRRENTGPTAGVLLTAEHRAAPSHGGHVLQLSKCHPDQTPYLWQTSGELNTSTTSKGEDENNDPIRETILAFLAQHPEGCAATVIREAARIRYQACKAELDKLVEKGKLVFEDRVYKTS